MNSRISHETDGPTPSGESLAALCGSLGEAVRGAGNKPIRLDNQKLAWFVEEGEFDVFVAEGADVVSGFRHVVRAGAGRLLFAAKPGELESISLIAKGLPGSKLRETPFEPLAERADAGEMVEQVDAWITDLTGALSRDVLTRPWTDELIDDTLKEREIEAGRVMALQRGVVWLSGEGAALLGTEEATPGGTGLLPLAPAGWLTVLQAGTLKGFSSRELHAEGRLFTALTEFHSLFFTAGELNRRLLMADEANQQTDRIAHRRQDEAHAKEALFDVLGSGRLTERHASALAGALAAVGRHEHIEFRFAQKQGAGEELALADVLRASGVRARQIKLAEDERWWRGDSGAMLGFRKEDGKPVALVPSWTGRYRIVDPASGRAVTVNAQVAGQLSPEAWFFYRPFPAKPVGGREALQFIGTNLSSDLARFALVGTLAGVLMLAPAVVAGVLASEALPGRSVSLMLQLAGVLAAVGISVALLQLLQGTAVMRIEGRAVSRIEAAIVDRMLGLPASFFRRYTAGDLATRFGFIRMARDRISGMVANAALSLIFLLPSFILIFLYDAVLGWLSLAIAAVTLSLSFVFGRKLMQYQRRIVVAARQLAGEMFQFIGGMHKLRLADAMGSAFALWATKYRERKHAEVKIGALTAHLVALSGAIPAFAGAALFAVTLWRGAEGTNPSDFLAVYVASMIFYVALARFGTSFEAISAVLPTAEEIEPILTAVPRSLPEGEVVAELGGDIRFDRVSFRYTSTGPLVLDDVSFHARSGEFVAIVGESGSGKSTLLRLALGLEEPAAGAVFYDGQDLANLNPRVVRRQVGTAMHDHALQPGSLLENIIGTGDDLTIADAWRAAKLAALDEDIAALPMGMDTVVGVGRAAFSGGQLQRVGIAAALARKPRIVFLDEATNWLDTENQAAVMRGIERLAATRIVVAHRLSTIQSANRIYVLDAGKIIQQGSFEELFETEGAFRDLVRRQIA